MPSRVASNDANTVDPGACGALGGSRRDTPSGSKTRAGDARIADETPASPALEAAITDMPPVDAERVAALSQAIDQGRYAADPHKIADRLLQLERDLAAAGRRERQ